MAAKTKYLDLSLIANLWLQIRQSKNFGGISMREQPAFSYDVFISYNSRDRQWVRKELLEKIEEAGLRAFIDFRDFIRGAPSIKEMERGVVECRKILVVLSPNYIGSEWCEIEAIMAQTLSPANRDLRMIPLLKKKCEKPLRIGALTHIDFTEGADFDLAWRQLVAALGGSDVSSKNSIPPEVQASLDQAKAMLDLGQYAKVIPVLRTAVDVADASGNVVAKVKSRCQLGHALAEAYEDFAAAEQQFRDALTFASPEWLELRHMVLHGLGDMLLCGGELDKARATADTSLELAKLSGNAECTADSLLSLGSIDLYCGLHSAAMSRFDEAIHMLLKQSLTISGREVDQNAHTLAACYINKAFAHQEIGELDEALLLYGKAEEQHQIYNNKLHAGKTLLFRGEAHCMNADWKKGIDAYQRALALFVDAANPLWICRCFEKMGQLYAIHQKWKEAIEATFHAIKACEESDNPEELVGLLIFLAQLIKDSDCAIAADDLHPTNLLKRAKELSQARLLRERMADFLVEEARVAPLNDPAVRNRLLGQAIDQLKEKLGETKFSKSRGHLMGFIGELYRKSGDRHQSLSWLKKAGDVFNNSGDILGLARYYLSLGGFYHSEHKLDEAAAAYRTALVTMEGRSSPFLAASIRISFAAALELQRNFSEAQQLLREAQALCIQHRLDNLMPKIAQNFDNIERELQSAQVSSYTLPQLISNLHQLLRFSTKHSVDYLLFWYYAWNTELRALLRSSHQLSLMVVTDDVARFMEFAGTFTHLYDHVLLASCSAPAVDSRREIIPIPLDWEFPANFPRYVLQLKSSATGLDAWSLESDDDKSPRFRIERAATTLPSYVTVSGDSLAKDQIHIGSLHTNRIAQQAIDLMVNHSEEELSRLRAIWIPSHRFSSESPFHEDLGIAHERGLLPVYFDRLPVADAVSTCDGVRILIPKVFFNSGHPVTSAKWKRALHSLMKLSKGEAQKALQALPEIFADSIDENTELATVEIHLFEFSKLGERICYPVLLIR